MPGPVLGLVALLGLVGFSVGALYIYYPAPKEAFEELLQVRTEALTAVNTGNKEEAIRRIDADADLRAELSRRGLARAEGFSPANYRERLGALYQRF